METITLDDLAKALAFIVGIGGSIVLIVKSVSKAIKALLKEQLDTIIKRMDKTDERLNRIDLENCKNFLVQTLSAADKGEKLTAEERMRLAEEYEHYTAAGGNSYIKDWHARLKADGKI